MSSEETNSPVEKDDEAADVTVVETEETDATETGAAATDEAADSDESAAESKADDQASGAGRRVLSWAGRQWVALLIAVLLVASAGAAGGVYWWMYRPDRLTDTAAQQQAVNAARDGTVALLSYAPDTLDKDLANAKGHLTGEFLKYYSQFTDQIVAPAAKQKGVKTEATVARAAVSEMHPDNAVVLVFVNQVTTSKDRPDPALATSSVVVKLTKNDGRWLISEFNPV
jgi:Mce-associated membrane protein